MIVYIMTFLHIMEWNFGNCRAYAFENKFLSCFTSSVVKTKLNNQCVQVPDKSVTIAPKPVYINWTS